MKVTWQYKLVLILSFLSVKLSAQTEEVWQQKPSLTISGFADVFYVFDFNLPLGTVRQSFLYNHNRHNELNLNLAYIKFGLNHSKYRSNIALQAGTYANDNYAAEPGVLKNIFEASIGISLNQKNNLWLDAGILPSHIGFESTISSDNWTMTRSILAENSPYFLAGTKLTFTPTEKWEIAGLLVNGWQRIQRLPGNSLPALGSQVKYKLTEKITLNWSSFIGTDDPDSTRRIRYFSNFYGQFQLTDKFGLIAGFDIGAQQRVKNSATYDAWLSPVIIGQFTLGKSWKTAIRAEYYQDKTGVIIPIESTTGFKTTGLSLNLDYSPTQNIICRLEGRWLTSQDNLFESKRGLNRGNLILGTSIAIRFSEALQPQSISVKKLTN